MQNRWDYMEVHNWIMKVSLQDPIGIGDHMILHIVINAVIDKDYVLPI